MESLGHLKKSESVLMLLGNIVANLIRTVESGQSYSGIDFICIFETHSLKKAKLGQPMSEKVSELRIEFLFL